MNTSKQILCTVIFGALLSTSCEELIKNQINKVVEKAEKATDIKTDKTEAEPEEESEEDVAVSNALNIYTGCINRTSKSVLSSRARYFSWAKDDTTKLPKSRYRGLFRVKSQSEKCLKELGALGDVPGIPAALYVAGKRYKTTLAPLVPVIEAAYLYYNEKDYKDDKGDKARKWHPMLVTGFRSFLVADRVMRKELAAITDVRRVAYLKKMEAKFGRTLPFLLSAVGQSATSIVRLADMPPKEVNVDNVQGTLEQYVALVTELETYAAAHPEEAKKYFAFSTVISAAVGLRKETKNFVRAHRGRSNRAKRKARKKVVDTYNRWIDRSNSAKR